MDTKAFLERVLPSTGGNYFCNYTGGGKLNQSPPLATLDDLVAKIKQRVTRKENVYFATGVYGESRTIRDARLKKALYVDLDTGPGKGFQSKPHAVKELKRFVDAAGLPFPTIVVDSGSGIHAYWVLTEAIPLAQWQPMANALKALCEQHGFAVDAPITADAARIMRVPGSYNYKDPSHPIPVRILHAAAFDYEVASFASRLVPPAPIAANVLAGSVDADDLGDTSETHYADHKHSAVEMIANCVALKHTRDTGGRDQSGSLWHKFVHLLAYTEDGAEQVHAISDKHDQYDPDVVNTRFRYALNQKGKVGPTRCATIEQYLPSKCAECPFKGKIKTPLVLGRTQDSFLPLGWKMDDTGIHKPTKHDDKGIAIEWARVIPYRFSNVELYSTAFGNGLQFLAHNGPRTHSALVLGVDLADDSKTLSKSLMMDHIMMTDSEILEFKRVMIPWMRKMEMVRDSKPAPLSGLGWMKTPGRIGFATGRAVYMDDGSESPVSGVDRTLCREYSPKGEPGAWKAAADAMLADGCHAIQAALLSSFAAPLLTFTGVSGVMLSLHSRNSGTGKSSALRVAQAVWGDPIRGVNALNDTANSMAKKFGFLNNLPAYWDEVRMRDEVRNFVRMVFQLGQGKEKQRLTSSAKMQEMGTWSTITTIATNEPVLDHVDAISSNTNAGRLRVFEVVVPTRPLKDTSVPFKLRDLQHHYGHVGQDYASWLAKNHADVDSLVQRLQAKVTTDLNATNDERFWVALTATLLAAALIVNRRGYVKIDIPPFQAWLYEQFRIQRSAAGGQYVPITDRAIQAVIDYADKFRDQFLVVEHATTRGNKSVGVILIQPAIREFLGLIATKDKILRVKRGPFRDWVYETYKESPSEIFDTLKTMGARESKASVSAGMQNTVNARVPVIDIDLTHAAFKPVLEDYDETPGS